MRSAELAGLVGTTVRTLRHYHRIGLLDEPPRTASGYREYGLPHLVRLLQVRRLVDLGLSLDAVAQALDGPATRRDGLLDALDAELAARIEQLQRRRAALRTVRERAGDPSLPVGSAGYLTRLEATGIDAATIDDERALLLLLSHGFGEAAEPLFAAVERMMVDPEQLARSVDALLRFRSAAEEDEDALVDLLREAAIALAGALPTDAQASAEGERLFALFRAERLTPVQDRILLRVEEALRED